jgi:hypothetical protein
VSDAVLNRAVVVGWDGGALFGILSFSLNYFCRLLEMCGLDVIDIKASAMTSRIGR